MPGLISPISAASHGTDAGMNATGLKRVRDEEAVPTYGEAHPKKRKVVHRLHHTQPTHQITEPNNGGFGATGDKQFFDFQLRRAIAVQCKGIGFDSARPEALEQFSGLVDDFMTNFLAEVRKSMSSARRTETVPHDWICGLKSAGINGSSDLESHLDYGSVPSQLLQPPLASSDTTEVPPPDLEGLLGPELSGKSDKESRKYIPAHFPPFPSKHTYKATPVFSHRENDPRSIREKAAEEGIAAEKSLRTLMVAQKAGLQKRRGGKRKQSEIMQKRNAAFKLAMEESLQDEAEREAKENRRRAALDREDDEWEAGTHTITTTQTQYERKVNLDEGVQVNYDRKFWRRNARGV
ncbi:unnamed protein product [Periconia digitata]|uniref:Transcription initiation factor TFIID subunit 8 n=1 Tax=Periconia digitata TaxID=1303443 RepID=A0A9W4UF12_9PLEO|nr:unnamed protein product [Periconia digitata]